MTGFLGKLFGAKKRDEKKNEAQELVENILGGIIQDGKFDLSLESQWDEENGEINVRFSGADEEILKAKEGQLLDAMQLFVKRVVQHQLPESRVYINLDVGDFREESNQALIDLADKLREVALEKGKSVYFRALAPRDRKVVHQYLAEDGRVKSRSVGEGHYKKIKIYPVRGVNEGREAQPAE